jgi:hypothetical protein
MKGVAAPKRSVAISTWSAAGGCGSGLLGYTSGLRPEQTVAWVDTILANDRNVEIFRIHTLGHHLPVAVVIQFQ